MSFKYKKSVLTPSIVLVLIFLFFLGGCHLKKNVSALYDSSLDPNIDTSAFLESFEKEMVLIEGGRFEIKADSCLSGSIDHSDSVRTFFISKYDITIQQFKYFILATGYITTANKNGGGYIMDKANNAKFIKDLTWENDEHGSRRGLSDSMYPILYVSWDDANAFCKWLSHISQKKYRLPTESEWEYAAIGGRKSRGYRYCGSDDMNEVSWNGTNSGLKVHKVGQKSPNELDLYDLIGNAWQWCDDWDSLSLTGKNTNTFKKKCKGGCFLSEASNETKCQCHTGYTGSETPDGVSNDFTFRVICEFDPFKKSNQNHRGLTSYLCICLTKQLYT